jgi:hypothetical protein
MCGSPPPPNTPTPTPTPTLPPLSVLQPAARTLAALESALRECDGKRGGALLNALCDSLDRSADKDARALALFLLERAASPYLRMLERWVFAGVLDDKFHEFMVVAAASGGAHATVGGAFVLRPDMTPRFLAEHAAAVLSAGQHLSVLRTWRGLPPDPLAQRQQQQHAGGRRIGRAGGGGVGTTGSAIWMPSPAGRFTAREAAPQSRSSASAAPAALVVAGGGDASAATADVEAGVFPAASRIPFSPDSAAYTTVIQVMAGAEYQLHTVPSFPPFPHTQTCLAHLLVCTRSPHCRSLLR